MDINDIGNDKNQSYSEISEIYSRRLSNSKFLDLGLFGINSPSALNSGDKTEEVYSITSTTEEKKMEDSVIGASSAPLQGSKSKFKSMKLPKLPFGNSSNREEFETVNRIVLENDTSEEKEMKFHHNKLNSRLSIDENRKKGKNPKLWCCLNVFSKQKHIKKRGSLTYERLNRY